MNYINSYNREKDEICYKDQIIENFFDYFKKDEKSKFVKDNLLFLFVGGSHAYGLADKNSDIDVRGFFRPSIDQALGFENFDQINDSNNDMVIYNGIKLINLITNQNPNILEFLWIDKEHILFATDFYWELRARREELLSKYSIIKFVGFADRQKKRAEKSPKSMHHAIRLFSMAIEILSGEGVKVDRTNIDQKFLMDIKQGEIYSTDFLIDKIHFMKKIILELYEASDLKDEIDMKIRLELTKKILGI